MNQTKGVKSKMGNIHKKKVKDLKPAGYNPRKISDEQLRNLKKALYEFSAAIRGLNACLRMRL